MALAYCILAHKNPAFVARLLHAIWHPDNVYVLHYDKRAPRTEHAAIDALARQFSNVRILPCRHIRWGRYSQVAAQLDALRFCTEWSSKWTHFINLTGQDFPLTSQSLMLQEMDARTDHSFVSFFDPFAPGLRNDVYERVTRIHIESSLVDWILAAPGAGRRIRALFGWTNRLPFIPFVRRARPSSFQYFKGANHFILSAEAGAYLLGDTRAQEIIHWLRWTGCPDESVVQTVLVNSDLLKRLVNDDRRAIYWARDGDPSPQTLTSNDLPRLEEAKAAGKLFARKFDPQIDEKVIHVLEEQLSNGKCSHL